MHNSVENVISIRVNYFHNPARKEAKRWPHNTTPINTKNRSFVRWLLLLLLPLSTALTNIHIRRRRIAEKMGTPSSRRTTPTMTAATLMLLLLSSSFLSLVASVTAGTEVVRADRVDTRPSRKQRQRKRTTPTGRRRLGGGSDSHLPALSSSSVSSPSRHHNSVPTRNHHHPANFDLNESRIVGGSPVHSAEKYPWFAQPSDGSCGATLVAQDILVSAAHCVGAFQVGTYVRLGSNTYKRRGVRRLVLEVAKHPQYVARRNLYDLLVIKIEKAPSTLPTARLNLNNDRIPRPGQAVVAIGFGATDALGKKFSKQLRRVHLKAMSSRRCKKHWGRKYVGNAMVCAYKKRKDACVGDSGGPLFVQTHLGPTLVGVTSWGATRCGSKAGAYARISTSRDWLAQQICRFSQVGAYGCPLPPLQFQLVVQYDYYSDETGWELIGTAPAGSTENSNSTTMTATAATTTTTPLASQPFGHLTTQYGTSVFSLPDLVPGQAYTVILEDRVGDGFYGKYGEGYALVRAVRGSSVEWQTAQLVGDFTYRKEYGFVVPESLSSSLSSTG